jgi:uncharacterized protein
VPRTCPLCRKPVPPRPENRAFPFCSDRCRLLDLGKWFGEEYRIPGPPPDDGGAETPAQPPSPEEEDA